MIDVSIVMALYDPDLARIRQVIASCWQQGCKVELVIVNDGSVLGLNSRDERIKVVDIKHHGMAAALNIGVHHAAGEFTVTLADDTLHVNALLAMIDALMGSIDPPMTYAYGNIQLPDSLVRTPEWRPHRAGERLRTSGFFMWHRGQHLACQFFQPPNLDFYAVDYDFILQLEARGVRGVHAGVTTIDHAPGLNTQGIRDNRAAVDAEVLRRYKELNK